MAGERPGRPPGADLVRIDSAEEQYACLLTRFGEPERWAVVEQRLGTAPDGRATETVMVRTKGGDIRQVIFVTSDDDDLLTDGDATEADDATGFLARVMEAAATFSTANPPHHPGTIARFPVPSSQYGGAVAVPMAVLAVEGGRPGLYAPPRVVVIDLTTGEALGVGEFPGFDPARWPPPRLGDWPPAAIGERRLEGMVARLSACWKRILDAWFEPPKDPGPDVAGDIEDALAIRAELDLPAMLPYYERLSPAFDAWLRQRGR
jgi:hypothetical protein